MFEPCHLGLTRRCARSACPAVPAGTVASAVRMLAKAEMTGTLGRILPRVDNSEETLLGKLTSENGIGWYVTTNTSHGSKPRHN
jgi:hypothetical protein